MELSDIYVDKVHKQSIPMNSSTSFNGSIQRERDPKIQKLENNIFNKIKQIQQSHNKSVDKKIPENKPINVQSIGLEQALNELLSMKKSKKDV